MRDREPWCQRQRLPVRRPGVGVVVQARLDISERQIGAWALGILGDELLRRRQLPADIILEALPRDLDLQLLGVRGARGESLGARQVGLEFLERDRKSTRLNSSHT